jgi:hypothetical protein
MIKKKMFFSVSHNNKNDLSHILILCLIEIFIL